MAHFILENAKRYEEPSESPKPRNGVYDIHAGYWKDSYSGNALVENDGFRNANTKKMDRETGEDQKGE